MIKGRNVFVKPSGQQLIQGDCLEHMRNIPEQSVDFIFADLPYGVTRNKWDSEIDLEHLWQSFKRILKARGVVVMTGQNLFSAKLALSNEQWFRYSLVWDKVLTTGFLNANRMPLRSHEDVLVFYKKAPTYNPQKTIGKPSHSKGISHKTKELINNNYAEFTSQDAIKSKMKHPKSILTFQKPHPSVATHPTQKPEELLAWLIKSYTNEGDTVLDPVMGSGTTGVVCKKYGRKFIGIEKDYEIFTNAKRRLDDTPYMNERNDMNE